MSILQPNGHMPNLRVHTGETFKIEIHPPLPGVVFEWHPEVKKVYRVEGGIGHYIASADTSQFALLAVTIYVRGYNWARGMLGK